MKNNLCIPVYLNDKTVFDLLAILEDGFSQIREVTNNQQNKNIDNKNIRADFSVSKVLSSLLGITLSGEQSKENENNSQENIKQEKIHTNVSLFSKLRKELIKNEILNSNGLDFNKIQEGDFVEVEGMIQKSPIVELLSGFVNMYKNLENVIDTDKNQITKKKNQKKQKSESEIIFDQIESMLNDVMQSNTIDLLLTNENFKVLLPSQLSYFQNEFEADILDGKFKVLGKVIKVIKNNSGSIDLFRKSSFKMLDKNSINEFMSIINTLSDDGMNVPKMTTKVKAPAMIMIPIAVYI